MSFTRRSSRSASRPCASACPPCAVCPYPWSSQIVLISWFFHHAALVSHRFIDILESQKFPRGILIYKTSMTPSANKVRPVFPSSRNRSIPDRADVSAMLGDSANTS